MQKLKAIHRALVNLVMELEEEETKFNLVTGTIIARANGSIQRGEIRGSTQDQILIKPRVKVKIRRDSLLFESEIVVRNAPVSRPLVLKTLPTISFVLDNMKDQALIKAVNEICREFEEITGGSLEDYRSLGDFKFFLSLLGTAV